MWGKHVVYEWFSPVAGFISTRVADKREGNKLNFSMFGGYLQIRSGSERGRQVNGCEHEWRRQRVECIERAEIRGTPDARRLGRGRDPQRDRLGITEATRVEHHATTGSVLSSRTNSAVVAASVVSMLLSDIESSEAVLPCVCTPPNPHCDGFVALGGEAAPFFADHEYGAERASRRARRRARRSSITTRSCSSLPRVAWFSSARRRFSSVNR